MDFLHTYLLHRFYYSTHVHKGRAAGSFVVVGCAGFCHSDTPGRRRRRGCRRGGLLFRCFIFVCISKKSFYHFQLRYRTDDIICICIYVCVICHTPVPRFIVYINPLTTFIVYITTFYSIFYAFDAVMFYCTLSEMTRIKTFNQSINQCDFVGWAPKMSVYLWIRCSHRKHSALIMTSSCQIHKIVGCACAGNAGKVFPPTAGLRSRHVPWCMSGSRTSGFLLKSVVGKTFPAFPAHA